MELNYTLSKKKSNRALQTLRGQQTVSRVTKRIRKTHKDIVIYPSIGTRGEPDIKMRQMTGMFFGCEVKRCQNYYIRTKTKHAQIGIVTIFRVQWEGLLNWCELNNALPRLIVEIYIPHSQKGHIYIWVDGNIITDVFREKPLDRIGFTVWDIIRLGEKL